MKAISPLRCLTEIDILFYLASDYDASLPSSNSKYKELPYISIETDEVNPRKKIITMKSRRHILNTALIAAASIAKPGEIGNANTAIKYDFNKGPKIKHPTLRYVAHKKKLDGGITIVTPDHVSEIDNIDFISKHTGGKIIVVDHHMDNKVLEDICTDPYFATRSLSVVDVNDIGKKQLTEKDKVKIKKAEEKRDRKRLLKKKG